MVRIVGILKYKYIWENVVKLSKIGKISKLNNIVSIQNTDF